MPFSAEITDCLVNDLDDAETYFVLTLDYYLRINEQAALTGVFNALYELHLPVLSVEFIDCGGQTW